MRKSLLTGILLFAAILSGCGGGGGGSDPPPKGVNIAYIYDDDIDEAEAYEEFLEGKSHFVTLVKMADITTDTDFSGYDLIIIGRDNQYTSVFTQERANQLNKYVKPVIGIGNGGLTFFSYSGLYTVHGKCATSSNATGVVVIDKQHPLWNSMKVDDGSEVVLYKEPCYSSSVYAGGIPADHIEYISMIGSSILNSEYIPLLIEVPKATEAYRYFYWGFRGDLSTMTDDGKTLFSNAVAYMASVSPPPPGPFKIIFYSNRDYNKGIYKMDTDGENVELILEVGDLFMMAVLSHNHRRIAYIENGIIYLVDLEGNPLKTIDPGVHDIATYVNWSPNDACLVFGGPTSTQRMYTINIVTEEITHIGNGKNPDWGPGDRIVYYTTALNTLVPGESPVTLKDNNGKPISGGYPSWSPTGDRISYLDMSATPSALKVINATGGEPLGVATGSIYFNNIWTPDGQYIIYTAHDGDFDIWKVRADGQGAPENLTENYGGADMLLLS